jgi:hypothetical protein
MFRLVIRLDSRCGGAWVRAGLEEGISQRNCDYCCDGDDEEGEELPLELISTSTSPSAR